MIFNHICRSINFEPAYIEATEAFYRVQAPDHLKENGVQASYSEDRGLQGWLFFYTYPWKFTPCPAKLSVICQAYMKYADVKLREEEQRATKYLESCSGSVQNLTDSCVAVLINLCHLVIISYKHHHHLVHGICVTGPRHRLQGHYPGRVGDDSTE